MWLSTLIKEYGGLWIYYLIRGSIVKGAINVILPGFKGYGRKGYKWRYLKQREIRLFGLMAERLFLDPIGYGNELK